MLRMFLLTSLCLSGHAAVAGPWMRPVGEGFVSVSREMREGTDWTALYAEYGISDHATFVLDAGHAEVGREQIAVASLRVPIWQGGAQRFAFTFGAGMGKKEGDLFAHSVAQAALNWGIGFSKGWATVDLTARETPRYDDATRKMDATLGYNVWSSSSVIAQAQYDHPRDKAEQLRVSLGWAQHFGPVTVALDLGQRLRQNRESDVKLALWLTF